MLGLATLVSTVGTGLFVTSSVLYFTRVVGLPVVQVGAGLTVAGLVGLLAGIPVGRLADRRDPRQVQLVTLLLMAVTMACYVFVDNFAVFAVVATVDMLAASASNAARGGLIHRVGGDRPAAFRSMLRAISNIGISLGALVAGVAIQLDTRPAYQVLVLLNAFSFVVCAVVYLRLPRYAPVPAPPQVRRSQAVRDWPFVAFTAVNGVMSLQYFVLSLPLPIWIAEHTTAPLWTVAAVTLINTVMCVFLQVKVGARVDTTARGSAAMRTAGLVFLVSCALMAVIADVPVWATAALVVTAVVVHTLAEMWHASATFALGFDLAPAHAQAQYQGLVHVGFGVAQAIAPITLMSLCIGLRQPGWLVLGGVFAAVGLLCGPVTRWAERTRPVYAAGELHSGVAVEG